MSYTASFTVDESPRDVFTAINRPRDWWSVIIEGETDRLGAVFYHHYQDLHRCTLKVTELVPGKRVVWHVLHNHFNFIKDNAEWNGTDIVFDIARTGDRTTLTFTHVGLVRAYECYGVCADSWDRYITSSLRALVTTGTGQPNPHEEVAAEARRMHAALRA